MAARVPLHTPPLPICDPRCCVCIVLQCMFSYPSSALTGNRSKRCTQVHSGIIWPATCCRAQAAFPRYNSRYCADFPFYTSISIIVSSCSPQPWMARLAILAAMLTLNITTPVCHQDLLLHPGKRHPHLLLIVGNRKPRLCLLGCRVHVSNRTNAKTLRQQVAEHPHSPCMQQLQLHHSLMYSRVTWMHPMLRRFRVLSQRM